MNDFLNEKYAALAGALEKNVKHIIETKNFDFRIMEEEFVRQGYREDKPSGVENILIFRLDYMGDFILTTPTIREIRANYPSAFITLVVNKAVYPMAELCPYVNEVIPMDVNYTKLEAEKDTIGMLTAAAEFSIKHLWKRNYTLCICLRHHITFLDLFLNYLSGAKERVGHIMSIMFPYVGNPADKNKDIAYYFLTHPVIHPKEIMHVCARNLYLLKAMGLQIRQTNAELWYDADDLYTAKKLLEGFAPNRIKVVTGIGSNNLTRKYPIEKYLAAFKKIIHKGRGSLIIVGGPAEIDDAKFLEKNLPKDSVKNLAGKKLGWRVDSAIMSLADICISNDSGVAQLSAATNIPTIKVSGEAKDKMTDYNVRGIFSNNANFFPWQTNTILIQPEHALGECKNKLSHGGCGSKKSHCITQIEPREIVEAYETFAKLIKSSGIRKTSCPPILNSVNQVPNLYSNLINP